MCAQSTGYQLRGQSLPRKGWVVMWSARHGLNCVDRAVKLQIKSNNSVLGSSLSIPYFDIHVFVLFFWEKGKCRMQCLIRVYSVLGKIWVSVWCLLNLPREENAVKRFKLQIAKSVPVIQYNKETDRRTLTVWRGPLLYMYAWRDPLYYMYINQRIVLG